jgi:hypothetical protein
LAASARTDVDVSLFPEISPLLVAAVARLELRSVVNVAALHVGIAKAGGGPDMWVGTGGIDS